MSLINSIPIDITENELRILYNFLCVIKNTSEFDLDLVNKYFDCDSSESLFELKKWVLSISLKAFYYTCDDISLYYEPSPTINDFKCEYCENEIHAHEYKISYSFNPALRLRIEDEIDGYWKEKFFLKEYTSNILALKKIIKTSIPFIGAGLSVPLGLPDWKKLLKNEQFISSFTQSRHRSNYEEMIEEDKLLEALDYLKDRSFSYNTDDQIKEVIIENISNSFNKHVPEEEHNIYDILSLDSNLYMTTNYDLCLEEFVHESKGHRSPLCLEDIDNIMKLMQSESQILHLHGHIDRKKSMIVSKIDYTSLYEDDELILKLQSIISQRSLLYIGFSFSDLFFKDMYQKLNKIFKNTHYIILANPTFEIVKQFNMTDIKVIGLDLGENELGETNYKNYVSALKVLIKHLLE